MIPHASVVKLYRHLDDDEFSRIMRTVEASLEEGLNHFELDVAQLDDGPKFDLLDAFEIMGYGVTYDNDRELFEVTIDD